LGTGLSWSAATDVGSKLAVLLTTFVLVRALAPVTFGQYIGLVATSMLAAAIWDAGSSTLLTREFAKGALSVKDALRQVYRLRRRLFIVWLLAFLLGAYFVTRGRPLDAQVVILFAIGSTLSASWAAPVSILRAALDFRRAGLAIVLGRGVTASISAAALLEQAPGARLEFLALAFVVGEAAILAASVYFVVIGPLRVTRQSTMRLTVKGSWPFAVNSMLSIIYNRFDVVILAALASTYQLSVYAPASRIQDALYVIPTALGLVALPVASALWSRDADSRLATLVVRGLVQRMTLMGLLLALPTAVLVWMYAPQLIQAVLGPAYSGASVPTRILVWFLPLAVVQAPLLAALAAAGYARDTTKVFAVTFVVAIGVHLSLDWWLGAVGGAIASLARDLVAIFVVAYLAWRRGLLQSPIPGWHLLGFPVFKANLAPSGERFR
jgi:O-antigen/teichoic acid export membrane protein